MNLLGDTTAPELTEEMGAMAESTTEGTGAQAAESTEEMTPPVAGFVETDPVISPLIQWKEISQFDWKEREKKMYMKRQIPNWKTLKWVSIYHGY